MFSTRAIDCQLRDKNSIYSAPFWCKIVIHLFFFFLFFFKKIEVRNSNDITGYFWMWSIHSDSASMWNFNAIILIFNVDVCRCIFEYFCFVQCRCFLTILDLFELLRSGPKAIMHLLNGFQCECYEC